MADDRDIYLALYKENCDQGRHHEGQRATVTNLVLTLAGVFVGLITFDQKLTVADRPAAIFVVVLGLYGALCSAKHYERFRAQMQRASAYRNKLDSTTLGIVAAKEAADATTKGKFGILYLVRLWPLWLGLHLFIAAFGAYLLCILQ
jgi:hypothetical protein